MARGCAAADWRTNTPSLSTALLGNGNATGSRRTQMSDARGSAVLKFVIVMRYSSASWARMLKVPEDRTSAVAALMEYFHGSLEAIYWEVETASAYVIANLPDSVSAAGVITAATRTGAFTDVRVHEVLTQEQLRDVVTLAQSSDKAYRPPGWAATQDDV
jgi:uncharacterized protein with GYD domain